ncbi:MAG: hypothetical protein AYK23_00320 [Candidatus Proteinoplasmatales archaeon SG8-5]|nr:MAG: hypothetical protein AYK23_00320 [Candidatus Proteinoplasmatales archaeon SG8-5]
MFLGNDGICFLGNLTVLKNLLSPGDATSGTKIEYFTSWVLQSSMPSLKSLSPLYISTNSWESTM